MTYVGKYNLTPTASSLQKHLWNDWFKKPLRYDEFNFVAFVLLNLISLVLFCISLILVFTYKHSPFLSGAAA